MRKPIKFPKFNSYVCEGDSVYVDYKGFHIHAIIERDDNTEPPDERDDGFWPSLVTNRAGYIGQKTKRQLANATKRAQKIMDAWKNDEWWYCGVCVVVARNGIALTARYAHSMWSVECNYPSRRGNAYLSEVASNLAHEALDEAETILDKLLEDYAPPERKLKRVS